MSTKIYDAFRRVAPTSDFPVLANAESERIRNELRGFSLSRFYSRCSRSLVKIIDRFSSQNQSGASTPGHVLQARIAEELKRLSDGIRSPGWDFSGTWTFFDNGKFILIKLFAEQDFVSRFEKAFPEYGDFHYQNSTDKPANVSGEEWALRRTTWKRIVGDKSFADAGISFSLWPEGYAPTFSWENFISDPEVMDMERRALSLAKDRVGNRWIEQQVGGDASKATWSQLSRAAGDWMDALETDQMVIKRVARSALVLEKMLPATIDASMVSKLPALLLQDGWGRAGYFAESRRWCDGRV